jgi:hypothetical protein
MLLLVALLTGLTVMFPSLGMTVQTEQLSVVDGQLGAPLDPSRMGVYEIDGNTLLVAHVDWGRALQPGYAFSNRLPAGGPIELSDGRHYHLAWFRVIKADDTDAWLEVAQPAPGADVLTLVTCTGVFHPGTGYEDRWIGRAELD